MSRLGDLDDDDQPESVEYEEEESGDAEIDEDNPICKVVENGIVTYYWNYADGQKVEVSEEDAVDYLSNKDLDIDDVLDCSMEEEEEVEEEEVEVPARRTSSSGSPPPPYSPPKRSISPPPRRPLPLPPQRPLTPRISPVKRPVFRTVVPAKTVYVKAIVYDGNKGEYSDAYYVIGDEGALEEASAEDQEKLFELEKMEEKVPTPVKVTITPPKAAKIGRPSAVQKKIEQVVEQSKVQVSKTHSMCYIEDRRGNIRFYWIDEDNTRKPATYIQAYTYALEEGMDAIQGGSQQDKARFIAESGKIINCNDPEIAAAMDPSIRKRSSSRKTSAPLVVLRSTGKAAPGRTIATRKVVSPRKAAAPPRRKFITRHVSSSSSSSGEEEKRPVRVRGMAAKNV